MLAACSRSRVGISYAAILAAVLIVAGGLRLALADYSFWTDEFASLTFAKQPLSLLWSRWMVRETNPPLFYSLLHGWLGIGAYSVVTLRLLPILCGMAGILLLAGIGWRTYGPKTAVAVAVLTGLSASNIFYSQQLRGYILAFDGVALSLLGMLLLMDRKQPVWRGVAIYAVGATMAIYAHTTMFLWPVIATLGFCIVQYRELFAARLRLLRALVIANGIVVLATAWWLYITLLQVRSGLDTVAWIKPLTFYQSLELILLSATPVRVGAGWSVAMVVFFNGLAIWGAILSWSNAATRLIAVTGCIGVLVLCLAEAFHPILLDRTAYWLSLFPMLLAASALGSIRNAVWRWAMVGGVAFLLAANLSSKWPRFQAEDWRGAIQQVAREPGGVLVVEQEVLGVVAAEACALTFPGARTCRVPIVVVDRQTGSNSWARGLYSGRMIALSQVADSVAPSARIYTVRRGKSDVLGSLKAQGASLEIPRKRHLLEGPFDRAELSLSCADACGRPLSDGGGPLRR